MIGEFKQQRPNKRPASSVAWINQHPSVSAVLKRLAEPQGSFRHALVLNRGRIDKLLSGE